MKKTIITVQNLYDMVNLHNHNMNYILNAFARQAKTNRSLKLALFAVTTYAFITNIQSKKLEDRLDELERKLDELTVLEEAEKGE